MLCTDEWATMNMNIIVRTPFVRGAINRTLPLPGYLFGLFQCLSVGSTDSICSVTGCPPVIARLPCERIEVRGSAGKIGEKNTMFFCRGKAPTAVPSLSTFPSKTALGGHCL